MTDKKIAPKDPEGEKKSATGKDEKETVTKKSMRVRTSRRVAAKK